MLPVERRVLFGILVLAVLLRVVWALQMRESPYFLDPQLDQRFFVEWGRSVANGEGLGDAPFVRAPLYAWYLGGVFRLFGEDLLIARLIQCGLGSVGVYLMFLVGRRVFSIRAGLVSAFLAATYWVFLYYDNELLRASACIPLNLLAILLTLRAAEGPQRRGLVSGVAWGVSVLLRPQVLLCLPFVGIWLARTRRSSALLLLIGAALPILPVTAYNVLAGGDVVLVSSEAGSTFWTANHPGADGVATEPPGIRRDYRGLIEDFHTLAEREEGRVLRPSESSMYWMRQTWRAAAKDPLHFLAHLSRKTRIFLTDWEFGNPEEPLFFAERYAPLVRWLPLSFGMILGLSLLGAIVAPRRKGFGLILSFAAIYSAGVILFMISSRYRLPVVPFLLLLAGPALVWLTQRFLARDKGKAILGLAGSLVIFAISSNLETPKGAAEANGLWWLGLSEYRHGNSGEAEKLFREAIVLREDFPHLHSSLGYALLAQGENQGAIVELRRAAELDPQDVNALLRLGAVLRQEGELQTAEGFARRAIALAPWLPEGWFTMGRIHLARGEQSEAMTALKRAIENDPNHFEAAFTLGVLALESGEAVAAAQYLELALNSTRMLPGELRERASRALADAKARAMDSSE